MTESSYCAIIAALEHVRPHPNADRLKLATVSGNQVVVGLEAQSGDVGVFFPTDGQLSHAYCESNRLYIKSAMDTLDLFYNEGTSFGYMDTKRRVRSQAFRGEKSDGLWMPLSSLDFTGQTTLKMGDTFTEVEGQEICCKYLTPAAVRAMRGGTPKSRKEIIMFPKHDVTKQFRFVCQDIPSSAVIYITEKLHGTSGRYGHVQDTLPLSPWKIRINGWCLYWCGFMPFNKAEKVWLHLNGSKNAVLTPSRERNSWYGTDGFRYAATEGLQLRKGEVIYYELVGYTDSGAQIMPTHSTEKLKDLRSMYGPEMKYLYGVPEGQCRLYVYKIIHINEDGQEVELSWPALVRRCGELGLNHVPLLAGPIVLNTGMVDLVAEVELHTDGPSTLSLAHIREGVVVRAESSEDGTQHIKNKSWNFGVMEGYLSCDDSFIDPEVVS